MKPLCKPPADALGSHAIVRPSVGRAIQIYLAKRPFGADISELEEVFTTNEDPALRTLRNLRARLNNMVCLGQLGTTGAGQARRWHAIDSSEGEHANQSTPAVKPAIEVPTSASDITCNMALPNTYDVMHAPVYTPPPFVSTRPGADDFRACPSRGHRC